tara:strand:+ start:2880 stop:3308 length:429 start_codon:yes stop_codon:yes gene_type:complete
MIKYYYTDTEKSYYKIFNDINLSKSNNHIFFLNGDIGSGKTSIVRTFIKARKIDKVITSPTFTLINEYELDNLKVFHYDLYKLKDSQELLDIGINDYLNQNAIHFFEWPCKYESILPKPNIIIDLISLDIGRLVKVTDKYNG